MAPPYIVCMALTVFVMCADECLAWNGVEIPDEVKLMGNVYDLP